MTHLGAFVLGAILGLLAGASLGIAVTGLICAGRIRAVEGRR